MVKRGQEYKTLMGQKVLYNRWMNVTPFSKGSVEQWRQDMNIDVVREAGDIGYRKVIGFKNYDTDIYAHDVKGIQGITNIVPEFSLLANYYSDILHRHFQYRYFGTLCDHLVNEGYTPKQNLFGLPYDPRRILETNYLEHYFKTVKETIEESVGVSGGVGATGVKKPLILTHSLGGVLFKWFLSTFVSEDWIQEYIGRMMVVNAPFGGTTMALRVIISGEYYVPMFHQEFKASLQKMAGILMCLPNEYAYDRHEPLVKLDSPERILRIQDFFNVSDGGGLDKHHDSIQVAFDIWRDMYLPHLGKIMRPIDIGSIPCDIVMGTQQMTIKKIKIKKEGELPYYTKFEMGDGQVPVRSLLLANKLFVGSHVKTLDIAESNHIDILSNMSFIQMVNDATQS